MANLTLQDLSRGKTEKTSQGRRLDVASSLVDLTGSEYQQEGTSGPTCGAPIDLDKIVGNDEVILQFQLVNGSAVNLNWIMGTPLAVPAIAADYGGNPATMFTGNPLCTDEILPGFPIAGAPKSNGAARRILNRPIIVKNIQWNVGVAAVAQRNETVQFLKQDYDLNNCNKQGRQTITWNNATGYINTPNVAMDEFNGISYVVRAGQNVGITFILSYKSVPTMSRADGGC